MRRSRVDKNRSSSDMRRGLRYATTYAWAFTVTVRQLHDILNGSQREMRVGDVVTGVSNLDRDAIGRVLRIRLNANGYDKEAVKTGEVLRVGGPQAGGPDSESEEIGKVEE